MNDDLSGTITISISISFEESETIKEAQRFSRKANFSSKTSMHEKIEATAISLMERIRAKYPAQFRQSKLSFDGDEQNDA